MNALLRMCKDTLCGQHRIIGMLGNDAASPFGQFTVFFPSRLQIGKQLIHIVIALCRRVSCNAFRCNHCGDGFPVGLIQRDFKRDPAFPKRLADKYVEHRGLIQPSSLKKGFGLCLDILIHADAYIGSVVSHFSSPFFGIICCLQEGGNGGME